MVMAIVRFNQVQPGLDPAQTAARYQATLDMAQYVEEHGFAMVSLEEHHGSPDGWSPSPLVMAGAVFGRCPRIAVTLSALLVPLHDPLRIAEDIAVLDLVSGGRLFTIAGLGYRPEEYAAHGKDWAGRGRLMDEAIATLLTAWTGEPFEYLGTTVQVTPRPLTQPHPVLLIGGTSKVAARRAARFGLPLSPAANLPELERYYYEQCAANGTQGFCTMPSEETVMLTIARDVERAWRDLGPHMLHEATTYASWQTPDIASAVHSHARTVEDLRAEGIYQIRTPEDAVEWIRGRDPATPCVLHPLVGGMPVDDGWESLRLFAEEVLPHTG